MVTPQFPAPSRFVISSAIIMLFICALPATSQELAPMARILDQELKILEHDFVPLAEAMPAEKYNFAPTQGEFKGVRTFMQQVGHTAQAMYKSASAVLEEKLPPGLGGGEEGPDSIKTKDEMVNYLKGAFVYGHKAMAKMTPANLSDEVQADWGKASRLFMADLMVWHSFDHYGQLVEYVRMNGIIPPSSRPKK
jgi:hypothetical protein